MLSRIQKNEVSNSDLHLSRWLKNEIPHAFLEQNLDECTDVISQMKGETKHDIAKQLREHLADGKLPARELFEQIKACFLNQDENVNFLDLPINHIDALLSRMPENHADIEHEILTALKVLPDDKTNYPKAFLNYAYIKLAGKMRLEKSVPLLLKFMDLDWECFNNEIPTALAQIGTDDAIEQTHAYYLKHISDEGSWIPNFLSSTFEQTQNPLGYEKASDLIVQEKTPLRISNLVGSLCFSMEKQAMQTAIEVWRQSNNDPEIEFYFNFFYTYAKLADQSYPEFPQWEKDIKKERQRRDDLAKGIYPEDSPLGRLQKKHPNSSIWNTSNSTPVKRAEPKVGRNDPCPCGSGKKHKRCCMH